MHKDGKGFYAILGLHPNATPAVIKAAYRARAMELHPDRNPSSEATAQFHLLQVAYDCLSHQAKRAAYDRGETETQSASPTDAGSSDRRAQPAPSQDGPLACGCCGAITAQPRFREFLTIISYIVSSQKRTRRGVFCVKCEKKNAAIATGVTLLLGWWGFFGFFWTLEALAKNLCSAWRFASDDAKLLCWQALYFASAGKLILARAVALDARAMAVSPKPTREQRKKVELGYEINDPMREIRTLMSSLIERTTDVSPTLELDRKPRHRQAAFLIQSSMVGVAVLLIAVLMGAAHEETRRQEAERIAIEQARLVQAGIERQRAEAIAQRNAEELRALQQPLPITGELRRLAPPWQFQSPGGLPELKVIAPNDANYVVKLSRWGTEEPVLMIFVRAGKTAIHDVPFGLYHVKLAAGSSWYGETMRFGPNTLYSQVDSAVAFQLQGNQLVGHELILSQVRNGNLRPSPIRSDQF